MRYAMLLQPWIGALMGVNTGTGGGGDEERMFSTGCGGGGGGGGGSAALIHSSENGHPRSKQNRQTLQCVSEGGRHFCVSLSGREKLSQKIPAHPVAEAQGSRPGLMQSPLKASLLQCFMFSDRYRSQSSTLAVFAAATASAAALARAALIAPPMSHGVPSRMLSPKLVRAQQV